MALSKAKKSENVQRAARGQGLVNAYIAQGGDRDYALRDMLADLMHMAYSDRDHESFDYALAGAQMHFNAEKRGE